MIGKSIVHYKIFEKPGSPSEILVFNVSGNYKSIISRGKGGIK